MQQFFAFDFDGVICDSARETARTAWYAAHHLWPERIPAEPSAEQLARFARLRPVIETGYENVPLVILVARGVSDESILGDFHALCEALIRDEQLDHADLRQRFGAARDAWIVRDLDGWLDAQDFFPGIVDTINALSAARCIITTKEDRFTRLLVERAGLEVPADRIYALEAFESGGKRSVLEQLAHEHPQARIHFFEDRLKTLDTVHHLPWLRCYLVEWGYNTPAERERARADAQVELLDRDGFARVLRTASP